nr:MAG TPA: hypothetical protein [Bacteriophage sp.]
MKMLHHLLRCMFAKILFYSYNHVNIIQILV